MDDDFGKILSLVIGLRRRSGRVRIKDHRD
jgi:hypothetical protein